MLEIKQMCNIAGYALQHVCFIVFPKILMFIFFVVIYIFKIVIQLTLFNIALSFVLCNYFLFIPLVFIQLAANRLISL